MLAKELLREGGSVICNIRRKICSVRWQFSTRVWMCMQEAGHIELMASRARARAQTALAWRVVGLGGRVSRRERCGSPKALWSVFDARVTELGSRVQRSKGSHTE